MRNSVLKEKMLEAKDYRLYHYIKEDIHGKIRIWKFLLKIYMIIVITILEI